MILEGRTVYLQLDQQVCEVFSYFTVLLCALTNSHSLQNTCMYTSVDEKTGLCVLLSFKFHVLRSSREEIKAESSLS